MISWNLTQRHVEQYADAGNRGIGIRQALLDGRRVWLETEDGPIEIVKLGGGGKLKGANGKVWDLFKIADRTDGSANPLPIEQAPGTIGEVPIAAGLPEGSMSIVNWSKYRPGLDKPTGPVRVVPEEEYTSGRDLANGANKSLINKLGLKGKNVEIHDLNPVKLAVLQLPQPIRLYCLHQSIGVKLRHGGVTSRDFLKIR